MRSDRVQGSSRLARSSRRRLALVVLLVGAATLLLGACGGEGDDSAEAGAPNQDATTGATEATSATDNAAVDEPLKLGVSFTALTPYDIVQDKLIDKELAAIGGEKLGPVANNFDPAKQLSDIRNLVNSGANGLYIRPADSQALGPAIDYAVENGVSVVVVDDTVQNHSGVFMNVKADNVKMGEEACRAMGEALGGQGKVLSLDGDPATANGRDRTTGFNDCMEAEFPGITVINRPTNWETEKAANVTQTVLGANPDLAGIYLQSETLFLAPVLAALKNANRTSNLNEPDHVVLVGIDGTPQALDAISEDLMYAVISQPLPLYAKYGVWYNVAAREGQTFSPGPTDHNSEIVQTGEALTDYLPATVVTKENVDDPELWGNSPVARG